MVRNGDNGVHKIQSITRLIWPGYQEHRLGREQCQPGTVCTLKGLFAVSGNIFVVIIRVQGGEWQLLEERAAHNHPLPCSDKELRGALGHPSVAELETWLERPQAASLMGHLLDE